MPNDPPRNRDTTVFPLGYQCYSYIELQVFINSVLCFFRYQSPGNGKLKNIELDHILCNDVVTSRSI